MIRTLFAAAAALALALGLPVRADERTPVVVELFTSQGCSSCPPADAFLGELARREDVLALGFHVDYWNYIGWRDPFSSPSHSQRQQDYARRFGENRVYTPQMVVDGRAEFPGGKRGTAFAEIERAARRPKAEARAPPVSAPSGITPHTMNRITEFIRPCIRSGVIAWRMLTCVML